MFFASLSVFLCVLAATAFPASATESLWDDDTTETVMDLPVTLKTNGTVSGSITLGDIFSGLESAKVGKKIASAPACGHDVVLDAAWLTAAARKNGLNWQAKAGEKLVLKRDCRDVSKQEILEAFKTALTGQNLPDNAEITLTGRDVSLTAPKDAQTALTVRDAVYEPEKSTVSGTAVLTENDVETQERPLFGKVVLFTILPVSTRPLAKGDVLTEKDLLLKKMPFDGNSPKKAAALTDLIGKETRRAIRAGQPVSSEDVQGKILVEKGKIVDVAYIKGGLSLKLQAKALDSGAAGDTVRVQNLQSKTVLQGLVTAPDTVSVVDGKKGEVK